MKQQKQVGYNFAVLGVIFLFIAVFAALYRSNVTLPYQVYSLPLFTIGIVFLVSGIAQVWIHYFRHERKPKPPTPKFDKKQEVSKMETQQQAEAKLIVNDYALQQQQEVKHVINNPPVQEEENIISTGTTVSILALVLFAALAIGCWSFEGSVNYGYGLSVPTYPYRVYSGVFVVGALISLAALLFSVIYSSKPSTHVVQTVNVGAPAGRSKILCGNCGIANDLDARYCKNCGNTFR